MTVRRGGRSRLGSLRLVHPVADLAAAKREPRTAATARHRIGLAGSLFTVLGLTGVELRHGKSAEAIHQ